MNSLSKMAPGKLSLILLSLESFNYTNVNSATITFPEEFTLSGALSGTADQSFTVFKENLLVQETREVIEFNTQTNTVNITHFRLKGSRMNIAFAVWLPPVAGKTNPLTVSLYGDTAQNKLLETNSIEAFLVLDSVSSYDRNDAPLTTIITSITDKFSFRLEFYTPKAIPTGSVVTIFDVFQQVVITPSSCVMDVYDSLAGTYGVITATQQSSSLSGNLGSLTFNQNDIVIIRVSGCFNVPNTAQTVYMDSSISDATKVILSQTLPIDFKAIQFLSSAFVSLGTEQGEDTVISVTFKSDSDIFETGNDRLILNFKETGSTFIDLIFSHFDLTNSANLIDIPCVAVGLSSVISCQLDISDQYSIYIKNYDSILKNQDVVISIHNLVVPNGNFIVNLQLVQAGSTSTTIAQNVVKYSSEATIVVNSPSLVAQALRSSLVSASVYTTTALAFNSVFDLRFELNVDVTFNTPSTLLVKLPTYGNGFILASSLSKISVRINGLDFKYQALPVSDWISISIGSVPAFNLNVAGPNVLSITSLQWPLDMVNTNKLQIVVFNAAGVVVKRYQYAPLPIPLPLSFETFSLAISDTTKSGVNILYTFSFSYPLNINENSRIDITFPPAYDVLNISPKVSASLLVDGNSFGDLTITNSKVIIIGLPYIAKSHPVTIEIRGFINPAVDVNDIFSIEGKMNDISVATTSKTIKLAFTNPLPIGKIYLQALNVFSHNENILTDYRFDINSTVSLSPGAIIAIDFPMQYPYFTPSPNCEIDVELKLIARCFVNNKTVNFEMIDDFVGGNLNLTVRNITNPPSGLTGPFSISFLYSSKVIASLFIAPPDNSIIATDGSDPQSPAPLIPINVVKIEESPKNLYVKDFYFSPNNEGELAEYYFELYIDGSIEVDQEILIIFPSYCDKLLGSDIKFSPRSKLPGTPSLSVKERVIYISNFVETALSETSTLVISIQGVKNPNRVRGGVEGRINIAIRKVDAQKFDYQIEEQILLDTSVAPGWLQINNIELANTYCRYFNDIRITFQLYTAVQTLGNDASLYLSFPPKFVLVEGDTYSCTLSYFGVTNSFYSPHCVVYGNKIWIWFSEKLILQGKFVLTINSIYNLEDEDTINEFILSSLDGYRKSIIERSYFNLDSFQFDFVYSGPLILVNAEQIIMTIQGTQTINIGITTDYPLALDLILKPLLPQGFALSPPELIIKKTEKNWALRITTFGSVALGLYQFAWEKLQDLIPGYYSPIKRTNLQTVFVYRNLITIERAIEVPLGGTNLDCKVYMDVAPAENLELQVRFKEIYPGISIENLNLAFTPSINEQFYSIFFTNITQFQEANLKEIVVIYNLIGKSSGIYGLNYQSATVSILDRDGTPATIKKAAIKILTQHNVTLTFSVSEPCDLFYMITLAGTDEPTVETLTNLGPSKSIYSQSQFGKIRFRDTLTSLLILDGLESITLYDIHFITRDRGGNVNTEVSKIQFMTNAMYHHALLNVFLLKNALSRIEKYQIISKVAFYLSLPIDHVSENVHKYGLNSTESAPDVLNLLISPMKDSPDYPPPAIFIERLSPSSVYSKFPYVDLQRSLYGRSVNIILINFLENPDTLDETENSIILSVNLDKPGYVYAVAIPEEKYVGYAPNSMQIFKGLSSNNEKYFQASIEVYQNGTNFNLTFGSLPSNQTFYIFLVPAVGSVAVPRLMERDYIVEIYASTLEPAIYATLSGASIAQAIRLLLVLAIAYLFSSR
jgi:hypothetical protein